MRPEPGSPTRWTRSSYCNSNCTCVETARRGDLSVLVRDAGNSGGSPVLVFGPVEWWHFTAAVKAGRFDL